MSAASGATMQSLEDAEALRANVYALLARLLARPPDPDLLSEAAAWSGDDSAFGEAVSALAAKARAADPQAVKDEYEALFIGLGRGELVPYASYYLTGFLHEKPLARVRQDLREIGAERDPAVKEPEDHIAALLDVMVGLILGKFRASGVERERAFFRDHINSWAPYFFKDLESAKAADFYRPVGTLGRLFLIIEETAFEMA
jgi:TorA maturation chaperone TorD